jgi:superfamily II DNA or RNA helicase
MKAVLSNRIYLECTREYREFLNEELTYIIPNYNPLDPPQVIKNIARVRENLVSIPIGRLDLIPEDYDIVDKRIHVPVEFPEFTGTLRQSQLDVYNALEDSCMINATPSWGKTFTGLAVAAKLGQKTLVISHTVPLRKQWEREVKKVFGFQPDVIGSGSFALDTPVVCGNVQTLVRNIPKIKKEFGTVILDEFHHVSARTFASVVDTNYSRYNIGLSASMKRKDGKHVVFQDYFGHTIYKPPEENSMTPTVDIIKTNIRFPDGAKTPWASRVNILTNNEEYQHLVAMLSAAYAAKGYRVLTVAQRVQFLKKCAQLSGPMAIAITGEIKDHEEREKLIQDVYDGEYSQLFGTQSIFAEGISVNPLSVLILATPLNNDPLLEQLIGRVCREHPNKLNPIIVDIHLIGNTARRQQSARMGYYMKKGYRIRQL